MPQTIQKTESAEQKSGNYFMEDYKVLFRKDIIWNLILEDIINETLQGEHEFQKFLLNLLEYCNIIYHFQDKQKNIDIEQNFKIKNFDEVNDFVKKALSGDCESYIKTKIILEQIEKL